MVKEVFHKITDKNWKIFCVKISYSLLLRQRKASTYWGIDSSEYSRKNIEKKIELTLTVLILQVNFGFAHVQGPVLDNAVRRRGLVFIVVCIRIGFVTGGDASLGRQVVDHFVLGHVAVVFLTRWSRVLTDLWMHWPRGWDARWGTVLEIAVAFRWFWNTALRTSLVNIACQATHIITAIPFVSDLRFKFISQIVNFDQKLTILVVIFDQIWQFSIE